MKTISLKSIDPLELSDEILLSNLNPNDYLKEAVELGRLEIVKKLFDLGATVFTLFPPNEADKYLEKCLPKIANYLALYNKQGQKSFLEMCFDEASAQLFGTGYGDCTNRNFHFETREKVSHWSLGLIEREANDPIFIRMALEICSIGEWEDRFPNVNLNETEGYFMVATLNPEVTYDEMDTQFISPNINSRFNVYLATNYDIKNLIAELTFNGEELIGISHISKLSLFNLDGSVQINVFDNMKETVSRYMRERGN